MGATVEMARYLLLPDEMLKQLSASSGPYEEQLFKHFDAKDFVAAEEASLQEVNDVWELKKRLLHRTKQLAESRKFFGLKV